MRPIKIKPIVASDKLRGQRYDLARKLTEARQLKPGLMKDKGGC